MDLLVIPDVLQPTPGQLVLMLSSAILCIGLLFWRRLAPGKWRSRLVSDKVKKAWYLMATSDQKIAFTRLIIEAAKADGKITGEENETIFEDITLEDKRAAQKMTEDEMFEVLRALTPALKNAIQNAMQTLLNSDGEFAPEEADWLAMVIKKMA